MAGIRIQINIPGQPPEVYEDVGQFVLCAIPQNMNSAETKLVSMANPTVMAQLAVYILKCAKNLLAGKGPKTDNALGRLSNPLRDKSNLILPRGMRPLQ